MPAPVRCKRQCQGVGVSPHSLLLLYSLTLVETERAQLHFYVPPLAAEAYTVAFL